METKLKATPGPWVLHLRDKTKTARVNGADGIYITQRDFTSNTAADQERIVSDLHLIAAAPDLYAALEAMLEVHGVTQEYADKHIEIPQSWVEVSEIARAALKRARANHDTSR